MSKTVNLSKKSARRAGPSARVPVLLALKAALADDVLRMLDHEPGARRFLPEDVHQMRTSVRRMRSDLRFFGPAMERDRSQTLQEELRWLAGVLGAVRDLDVLADRLRSAAVEVGAVPRSDPLFEEIARRQDSSRAALAEAIDGRRYLALREAVIAEARAPSPGPSAGREAASVLVDRLVRDRKRLLDRLKDSPADSPIETLHELRKRAKRTRYAAHSAADWLGRREAAGRACLAIARQAKAIQEVLGCVQDASVADAFIREVADALPADDPFRSAAGALLDHQRREAEEALACYSALREEILGG
ncbi:CHAD domain-containing protein [Tautonia sociabilis]|uniref:CHAD domain-containing protein n=1 Tax=Tautonia sociabilis TaxID=2080755 RepID=A0A432MJB2_9BACT|nr:CHAD domain-containing protein [Tautonia sociabilis]RUL87236.1 CHAD domain-containing protein [Tautonia sociabilis]